MKIVLSHSLGRQVLMIAVTVLVNGIGLQKTQAGLVDLDALCQEFPLNPSCQGYKSPQERQKNKEFTALAEVVGVSASRLFQMLPPKGVGMQ